MVKYIKTKHYYRPLLACGAVLLILGTWALLIPERPSEGLKTFQEVQIKPLREIDR